MLKCIRYAATVPLVVMATACSTGGTTSSQTPPPPAAASTAPPVAEDSILKKDSLAALQSLYSKEPKAKEIGAKPKRFSCSRVCSRPAFSSACKAAMAC